MSCRDENFTMNGGVQFFGPRNKWKHLRKSQNL